MKIFVSGGGGVRIGETFGAEIEGERQLKFHPSMFQWFGGTSAGALDAVLTANGWKAKQKATLFIETDFAKFFTLPMVPFSARKIMAVKWPMKMNKLADFFNSLTKPNKFGPALTRFDNLLVNTVDCEENIHVIYCENLPDWFQYDSPDGDDNIFYSHNGNLKWIRRAFSRFALGKILTESMCLPGLMAEDESKLDGGVCENPLFTAFPKDAELMIMDLGYSGHLVNGNGQLYPKETIDRALYSFEFKAHHLTAHLLKEYPAARVVYPSEYKEDSANFGISKQGRAALVASGQNKSAPQWASM